MRDKKYKNHLREKYPLILQVSLSVSIILTIMLFVSVKSIKINTPSSKDTKEIIGIDVGRDVEIVKPPPPPKKPVLPVEVTFEEKGEEEDLPITTGFKETEDIPKPPPVKTYEYYEVEELPEPIKRIIPPYPEMARALKVKGTVWVMIIVGEDGTVKYAEILKSPHPVFDEPVLEAVKKWVFRPGRQLGKPVPVRIKIKIPFVLEK